MNFTLHLSTACNMRCSYCYAPPHAGTPMSLDVARAALDLATRLSGRRSAGIAFFGGEPLLHKELVEWVVGECEAREKAQKGRFHFKITTNGLALDAPFVDWCVTHKVHIAMSFDGNNQAQDRHRRLADGSPSFEILLPRLRILLARRPYASVFSVVTPDTVPFLAESMSFLLDQGVRRIALSLDVGHTWNDHALQELRLQYEKLASLYLEWSRAGRKFFLSPFEVKISSHILGPEWVRCRCSMGEHQVSIDPEGWLYPCVQFPCLGEPWRIGHVRTGFDEAARARLRGSSNAVKKECKDCSNLERCTHTCGCTNLQATGSLERVSSVHCFEERVLTPLADSVAETLYKEGNRTFLVKHYDPAGPLRSLIEDLFLPGGESTP